MLDGVAALVAHGLTGSRRTFWTSPSPRTTDDIVCPGSDCGRGTVSAHGSRPACRGLVLSMRAFAPRNGPPPIGWQHCLSACPFSCVWYPPIVWPRCGRACSGVPGEGCSTSSWQTCATAPIRSASSTLRGSVGNTGFRRPPVRPFDAGAPAPCTWMRTWEDPRRGHTLAVEIDGSHHYEGLNTIADALRQNELAIGATKVLRRFRCLGCAWTAMPSCARWPGRCTATPQGSVLSADVGSSLLGWLGRLSLDHVFPRRSYRATPRLDVR